MIKIHHLPSQQLTHVEAFEVLTGRRLSWNEMQGMTLTYAITDGEFMKVGRGDHITRRMSSLQTANPRELFLYGFVDKNVERIVQRELTGMRLHVRGEWFVDNDQTRSVLNEFGFSLGLLSRFEDGK